MAEQKVITNLFVDEQREIFNKCVVKCRFQKIDGSIREAIGTTNLKFIPIEHHPKNPANIQQNQISYFDLESYSWKSMTINTQFIIMKIWKSVPNMYKQQSTTISNG